MSEKQKEKTLKNNIFEEQLRIFQCCGYINLTGDRIDMSTKYFMEMLVRPSFGDSEPHYDKINKVFIQLEKKARRGE